MKIIKFILIVFSIVLLIVTAQAVRIESGVEFKTDDTNATFYIADTFNCTNITVYSDALSINGGNLSVTNSTQSINISLENLDDTPTLLNFTSNATIDTFSIFNNFANYSIIDDIVHYIFYQSGAEYQNNTSSGGSVAFTDIASDSYSLLTDNATSPLSDLQIVNTNPTETIEIDTDDSQTLTISVDRNATVIWYEDNIETRTVYNTTSSDFYFTSSTVGTFNLTAICSDSLTNTSQVNFTWTITVIPVTTSQLSSSSSSGGSSGALITEIEIDEENEINKKDFVSSTNMLKSIRSEWYALGILSILILLFLLKDRIDGSDDIPGQKGHSKR